MRSYFAAIIATANPMAGQSNFRHSPDGALIRVAEGLGVNSIKISQVEAYGASAIISSENVGDVTISDSNFVQFGEGVNVGPAENINLHAIRFVAKNSMALDELCDWFQFIKRHGNNSTTRKDFERNCGGKFSYMREIFDFLLNAIRIYNDADTFRHNMQKVFW